MIGFYIVTEEYETSMRQGLLSSAVPGHQLWVRELIKNLWMPSQMFPNCRLAISEKGVVLLVAKSFQPFITQGT